MLLNRRMIAALMLGAALAGTPATSERALAQTGAGTELVRSEPKPIAFGQPVSGDFADANDWLTGKQFPMTVYAFEGRKGQVVTARVTSSDVHTNAFIGTKPHSYSIYEKYDKRDPSFDTVVTGTLTRDGPHYLAVLAQATNKHGGRDPYVWLRNGTYTLTLTEGPPSAAPLLAEATAADAPAMQLTAAAPAQVLAPAMPAPATDGSAAAIEQQADASVQPVTLEAAPATSLAPPSDLPGAELMAAGLSGWGDWAALAGTTWVEGEATMIRYSWKIPGEVMVAEVSDRGRKSQQVYSLATSGDRIEATLDEGERAVLTSPRPGVVVRETIGTRPQRVIYRFSGDRIHAQVETMSNGAWTNAAMVERRRVAPAEVAALEASQAEARAAFEKRWGVMAQLAGKHWIDSTGVHSYEWLEFGKRLKLSVELNDQTSPNSQYFRPNPEQPGTLDWIVSGQYGTVRYGQVTVFEDGTIYWKPGKVVWQLTAPGRIESVKATVNQDGTYTKRGKVLAVIRELSDTGLRDFIARRDQRLRQQAAKKASGGGGVFGTLVGAAVGAYAGAAAGLDTSQVAGAMMKGASVTSTGPIAGVLGSTGDQLLSGGSTSAMGAMGGTGGGGASYPTKPNLAANACSGFSEANYRSKAVEGGGDSQLNTMCGQAFEYYTMYKRAIAQGYSEADANRTYAAHEQAARVASGYLSSHGAN